MDDKRRTILVFGATGRQGGSVARALLRQGWRVRSLVRDATTPRAEALGRKGVELASGDLSDLRSIRTAMDGAHGVFSVLPGNLNGEDEIRFGEAITDLAAELAVEHLVYSSGASVGEEPTGVPRFDAKPRLERHVRGSAVPFTIVRPMIFMEMLLAGNYGLEGGRFDFLVRPDQAMQLLAVEDIGRLVAAIFANAERFAGTTLTIASDTVTGAELAAGLSEALKRPIAYSRFSEAYLSSRPDFARMVRSLVDGPLSHHADLELMREMNPGLLSFQRWLAGQRP